ncbi:MAG: hypothetical protein KDE61_10550, partial [Novosphingobium sp.]|nr:hypothetical protein [Novosphingobium sp.]
FASMAGSIWRGGRRTFWGRNEPGFRGKNGTPVSSFALAVNPLPKRYKIFNVFSNLPNGQKNFA